MSEAPVYFGFAGPAEHEMRLETDTGTRYRFDKSVTTIINHLRPLPLKDLLSILDVSDSHIEAELQERKAILSDKALGYLKDTWYYQETGDKVKVGQGFIEDFLNQDVTKRTVYRRLKERRMPIHQVKMIIGFFEDHNFYRKTNTN